MTDDPSKGLADGWEAFTDDAGRTYWWNTESNETTWEKPVAIIAKKGIAAGYLNKVQQVENGGTSGEKPASASSGGASELEQLRRGKGGGSVSARLAHFNKKSEPEKPAGPPASSSNRKVDEVNKQFNDPAVFFDGSMVGSQAVGRNMLQDVNYGKVIGQRGPPKLQEPMEPPPAVETSSRRGSGGSEGEGSSPGLPDGRKSVMSVDAMRKLQEAKKYLHEKEKSPTQGKPAAGTSTPRDARANAPPKVDLYS